MTDQQAALTKAFLTEDDPSDMYFYGAVKVVQGGFGWISCADTHARFGKDIYLSREDAADVANDQVVGAPPSPLRDRQWVKFQVTTSEGYPQATAVRRVRRLIGEVQQLPGELAADGILSVKGDPDGGGGLDALMGKEVRICQADCKELRLHEADEVIFFCMLVGENPPMLEGNVSELRSTNRKSSTLMGCISLEIPRVSEPVYLRAHALPDRIVLAGIPEDMKSEEIKRIFSEFGGKDVIVTHDDADCTISGFASVSFPGASDVAQVLLRTYVQIVVGNAPKVVRISHGARGHEEFGKSAPLLPALPRPVITAEESHALMVRWSQVSLAAGYLVELRPVNAGVPGVWTNVDVAAGSLDKGSKLPPGLLGPQCHACRVNGLKEVPYEARISYFTVCGCRSQSSQVSEICSVPPMLRTAPTYPKLSVDSKYVTSTEGPGYAESGMVVGAAKGAKGPDWRAPSGNLIPAPAAPELVSIEEPVGCRSIVIQWPTIVHATAYVVELFEETAQTMDRFHRQVPENLKEVLVELRVQNLQPTGLYSARVKAVAPCGAQSTASPWSVAPAWFPSYLPGGWQAPPISPMLHNGASPVPLLSTNPLAPIGSLELEEREVPDLGGTAEQAAALVLD